MPWRADEASSRRNPDTSVNIRVGKKRTMTGRTYQNWQLAKRPSQPKVRLPTIGRTRTARERTRLQLEHLHALRRGASDLDLLRHHAGVGSLAKVHEQPVTLVAYRLRRHDDGLFVAIGGDRQLGAHSQTNLLQLAGIKRRYRHRHLELRAASWAMPGRA